MVSYINSIWFMLFGFPKVIADIGNGCIPLDFDRGSFVCVCNVTHCDDLAPLPPLVPGDIFSVVSDRDQKRWSVTKDVMSEDIGQRNDNYDVVINVDRSVHYQTVKGFGGAFTDATGVNLRNLNQKLREDVLKGYFDVNGLEYNVGRVPIAGTDFSTHMYTYDDLPPGQTDSKMKYFSLAEEDYNLKIPMIKYARDLCSKRGVKLYLFSSPWGAPGWMKSNGQVNGKGTLLKKYYPAWATYMVKFFKEYQKNGIKFDGLTAQNEPTCGLYSSHPFNAVGWHPEDQGEWISDHLGPQMLSSGFDYVTIIIGDDNRGTLPKYPIKILQTRNASAYVGGIAVHWYGDYLLPPSVLDETHDLFPHLPLLYSEACAGWAPWDADKVILGDWVRAEQYAEDIIQDLNHWVVGWTDWNLALDLEGGPNWVENFVDAPIIVNKMTQEFYRQPMFYALAHFSKILPRGAVRLGSSADGPKKNHISFVIFQRPDNSTAMIALNRDPDPVTLSIEDSKKSFKTVLGARSITSFVWRI